jgi:hypothetical protein
LRTDVPFSSSTAILGEGPNSSTTTTTNTTTYNTVSTLLSILNGHKALTMDVGLKARCVLMMRAGVVQGAPLLSC